MDVVDDVDIAVLIMDEDEEGLRLLLDKYGGKIKKYLKRDYGQVLSPIEINEALFTATHKVWLKISQYDDEKGGLGTWFIKIAQRCALDIIRRQNTYRDQIDSVKDDLVDSHTFATEVMVVDSNKKLTKAFNEALEKLPPLQKAVIKADLAAEEGKADAARIALEHGTTAMSVRVSRSKAKDTLKRMLAETVEEQTKRRRS